MRIQLNAVCTYVNASNRNSVLVYYIIDNNVFLVKFFKFSVQFHHIYLVIVKV